MTHSSLGSASVRLFGAIAIAVAIGLPLPRPTEAADADRLVRAIIDAPFDQSRLREGFRYIETIADGPPPEEAAGYDIVGGAAMTFQGPSEFFHDVAAFYLIFATEDRAGQFYDLHFDLMVEEKSGLDAVTDLTIRTVDGEVITVRCFLSATEEAFSCMYIERDLSAIIQIVAGPGPRYDESIGAEGLRQAFMAGDGALALSGVITAARSHLQRAVDW